VRRSSPRYEIVFMEPDKEASLVVHSTRNPDEATVLFAVELQRLLSDRANGELAIRRMTSNSADPDIILRQELVFPMP
jgi:hypothetical protein